MGQKILKPLMPPDFYLMQFNSGALCFLLGAEGVAGVSFLGGVDFTPPMVNKKGYPP